LPLSVKVAHLSLKQGELEHYQQRQPFSEGHANNFPTKNKHPPQWLCPVAVSKHFMNDILNKAIVLVLNRNWQAVNVRTPQEAFCMMATSVATALEIEGENHVRPVTWGEWTTLSIRSQDNAVQTVRGPIRVPTVIVAVNYAKVPKKRPKLCARSIRERDGNRCQYTGRVLRPYEGSLDHVLPRSRGGKNVWENLVWAGKDVNARKGNRLPHEAGLKLLSVPRAPKELPATALIRNSHDITEWKLFVRE
jgi:5-methylcytosine-specific restriction endonuclease McrA